MSVTYLKLALAAGAMAFACPTIANAATIIPIGTSKFFITEGTPTSPSITAFFMDSFSKSQSFDDIFTFTIPQNGTGSGSLSTSFSSSSNMLTITDLIINGTSYPVTTAAAGQSALVGSIPIVSGVLNTIEVIGSVTGKSGFTGTATFAAAVPEPTSWALMVAGFGMVGWAARRRRQTASISFA